MSTDFAVVGRGLWGTAAALYLARAGHSITLIGPSEPGDTRASGGPFASHHDAGRISRSIARDGRSGRAAGRAAHGALGALCPKLYRPAEPREAQCADPKIPQQPVRRAGLLNPLLGAIVGPAAAAQLAKGGAPCG